MGGFSNAFWLWFPVLIYKAVSAFFKTIRSFIHTIEIKLWMLR